VDFTLLEQARRREPNSGKKSPTDNLGYVVHTPEQMINWLNRLQKSLPEIVISGGINNAISAHELMLKYKGNSIAGMAGEILKYATGDYQELSDYLSQLRESFAIAKAYIKR